MPKMRVGVVVRTQPLLSLQIRLFPSVMAQSGTANGEWRYCGGDAQSIKNSPLDQLHRDNVTKLQDAWIWKTQNFGLNPTSTTRERL